MILFRAKSFGAPYKIAFYVSVHRKFVHFWEEGQGDRTQQQFQ